MFYLEMVGGVQVSKDMTNEVGQGALRVFVCLETATEGEGEEGKE